MKRVNPIKYVARVSTKDNSFVDYTFFARSKADAKKTAQELYYNDYGNTDVRIGLKADKPSEDELSHINKRIIEVLAKLKQEVSGKSYSEFVKMFYDFDGWDLILSPSSKSFMMKFNNFTCMVEYSNGVASINEEEILYYSEEYNRTYSIRNYCVDIFITV